MEHLKKILKDSYDLQEQEPEKSAYWHLQKLRSEIEQIYNKQQLISSSASISLDEINEAADNALELTKLPTNPTTTERERELGHRAFKNGAIWAKIKYEKSNEYFFY